MTSGRDGGVDILRGICVLSMVIGHIAEGSTLWRVVHIAPVGGWCIWVCTDGWAGPGDGVPENFRG